MADTILSYTIPEAKVSEYVEAYCYLTPNEEKDENGDPKYTDAQWVREHILRQIKSHIVRGKNKKAKDELSQASADDVV